MFSFHSKNGFKCIHVTTKNLLQVPSQLEETDLLLNLPPERIGHGTFLHPDVGGSKSLVDKVVKNNIPLGKTKIVGIFCSVQWFEAQAFVFLEELCLTSNFKGQTVPCYSMHHFKYWFQLGHPCVICVSCFSLYLANISAF